MSTSPHNGYQRNADLFQFFSSFYRTSYYYWHGLHIFTLGASVDMLSIHYLHLQPILVYKILLKHPNIERESTSTIAPLKVLSIFSFGSWSYHLLSSWCMIYSLNTSWWILIFSIFQIQNWLNSDRNCGPPSVGIVHGKPNNSNHAQIFSITDFEVRDVRQDMKGKPKKWSTNKR